MKVLQHSTNELEGGAARAANRLHQGLVAAGIDSHMLVQSRTTTGAEIHSAEGKFSKGLDALRPTLDQLPLYLRSPAGLSSFCLGWFPDRLRSETERFAADIVHLHWVAKGALRIESIANLCQPVLWTLHDMWPMTGGCYHSRDCTRFMAQCGACPQLESRSENDLSRWVWKRKRRSWAVKPEIIICPSRWMADLAASSSLFAGRDIRRVPNGVDLERFRPNERQMARRWLGLPEDQPLALFSAIKAASNPYKGFRYLPQIFEALKTLDPKTGLELVVLGDISASESEQIRAPVHRLGRFTDDVSLALAYAAVDVFLIPSDVENLPNTVIEALACGTPVAGFAVGGIPEMVSHRENGWLAQPGDVQDLARGLQWMIDVRSRWQELALQARKRAESEFSLKRQVESILEIYEEVLKDKAADPHG